MCGSAQKVAACVHPYRCHSPCLLSQVHDLYRLANAEPPTLSEKCNAEHRSQLILEASNTFTTVPAGRNTAGCGRQAPLPAARTGLTVA